MGGIKNKSLLNKVANKGSLWLKLGSSASGAASRRTPAGRVFDDTGSRRLTEGSPKSGSRLPSFSQPSEMLTRNISNTRKFSHWSLYASKTIGSLRLITLTKYLGIACLSLAILSTLILNIVSSYSYSKVNSNAEPVGEASTLDNNNDSSLCDPTNTNAASCISMSISSYPATQIPQGGGLVAGRHTVSVKSNNINGYQLRVEAASGIEGDTHNLQGVNLELVHNDGSVDKEHTIPSLTQDNGKSVNYGNTMPIENNTWGIAIPGSSLYGSSYDDVSVYESYITNPRRIATGGNSAQICRNVYLRSVFAIYTWCHCR